MKKYYIELQDEPKACGAYCIYMILKHHGIHIELNSIKDRCRMDMNGISMKGMLECLKSLQIEAKGYKCSLEDIKNNVKLPCILHLAVGEMGHYVVLYEIKDDEYIIGDPSFGLITMYKEEIEEKYSSYMIAILHIGRVNEAREKSYFQFVKESFMIYKDEVKSFLAKGLFISCLGLMTSLLFQIIIDYFDDKTHYFYMACISFMYLFIHIIKIIQERYQQKHLLELQRILDEEYCFDSMKNMLYMPMHILVQEKGIVHSQLLSLSQLSEMNLLLFESVLLNGISMIIIFMGMIWIEAVLSCIVLVFFIIIIIYMKYQVPIIKKLTQSYLEKYHYYHQSVLEWIENLFVIKRFHQSYRTKTYYNRFESYMNIRLEKEKKIIDINTNVSFIIQGCFFLVLLLGLWQFSRHIISLGKLVMFYMLLSSLLPIFLSFVSLFNEYHTIKMIYERYKSFRIEKEKKDIVKEPIKKIYIDDLSYSFGYRNNLFSHLELLIDKNLYIKGDTGSGKSTLLSLLMGNDLRYNGNIYINDQELRTIDLDSLYEHIGYECQSPHFFCASVYENLLCEDIEKIENLLKAFGHSELLKMLEIILDENGNPLSLGQRQIIALVRLFVREYDVYILDEVFSHMDNKSAGKIYRYIVKKYSDKILIMVNHQTKLVNRNDDYIIIDNGNLIKKGD